MSIKIIEKSSEKRIRWKIYKTVRLNMFLKLFMWSGTRIKKTVSGRSVLSQSAVTSLDSKEIMIRSLYNSKNYLSHYTGNNNEEYKWKSVRYGRRPLLLNLGAAFTLTLCLYIASDLLIPLWEAARYGQVISLILMGATYGSETFSQTSMSSLSWFFLFSLTCFQFLQEKLKTIFFLEQYFFERDLEQYFFTALGWVQSPSS